MLLKALYDYAEKHRLFDELPLQPRTLHALIGIDAKGRLRSEHLIALTQTDEKGKERLGQERLMPRFPGENNGGKAYFLAESAIAVLGRDKTTGEPIPANPREGHNPTKAFLHFWEQVQQAYDTTKDSRLAALLTFRSTHLVVRDGKIASDLPFLVIQKNKNGKPELIAKTNRPDPLPLKAATVGFSVDGCPLTMENESDPLRKYWFKRYTDEAFQGDSIKGVTAPEDKDRLTLCLVTGQVGQPIARSHKPKILGIPGLSSGGYIVSFAKEAPAFSSYGFEMGQNAPISERAASSYALAINKLLRDEDTHINLGSLSICFWARELAQASKQFNFLLSKAYPEQVAEFLRAPFAGVVDREILRRDRLYTVALAGNAGRVVIQHWLDQTLDQAIEHFHKWWDDLQIINLYSSRAAEENGQSRKSLNKEPPASPLSIINLVGATLRRSKDQRNDKLVRERIIQLYHAAFEATSPPFSLLKPLLDEFHSALVKNDESDPNKRTYPFSQSRFALIKLILIRNRKEGGFMPTYELADTPDPAYNLGCLLAVFEGLQDRYHNSEQKGAGIVERYYGTASSAPAFAFPILYRLARHHLSRIKRGSERDKAAAYRIEERITEILSKFQSKELGKPPLFPRMLSLEEQGRFALGFYQQKAQRPKKDVADVSNESGETSPEV